MSSTNCKSKAEIYVETIQSDKYRFLSIFPEEIWKYVLASVTEVEALENLANSTHFFSARLKERRVLYLFPSVWPLLYQTLKNDMYKGSSQNLLNLLTHGPLASSLSDVFGPRRSPKIPLDILKLRLVCKAWCYGVDSWCENVDNCRKINTMRMFSGTLLPYWYSIDHCLEYFDKTHGHSQANKNPFVGRAIELEWQGQADTEGQIVRQEKTLQQYGAHVWHCNLFLWPNDRSTLHLYYWLDNMLTLLPNLQTLRICGDIAVKQKNNTELILQAADLPQLKKLKYLSVEFVDDTVLNAILRQTGYLEQFQLTGGLKNSKLGFNVLSTLESSLKKLSFKIGLQRELESLANLRVNWPLEEVSLQFDNFMEISWTRVFLFLNKCEDTLTSLSITFPENLFKSTDLKYELNLPKLSRLEIYMNNSYKLDFLLPFSNLLVDLHVKVEISWNLLCYARKNFCEMKHTDFPFLNVCKAPAETHLWLVMPKLKKISLTGSHNVTASCRPGSTGLGIYGSQTKEEWIQGHKFKWNRKLF